MLNMQLKNIDAVFFDFDGVIVESTDIKTEAFYDIFLEYGEDVASYSKSYHMAHQGVTRFAKFDVVNRHFNLKLDEQVLSQRFSQCVLEKILAAQFVNGIIDFLERLKANNKACFLLSATPHQELVSIVKQRQLAAYFAEIIGAPKTKTQSGKEILVKYKLTANRCIFIGDSVSDLNAAENLIMPFVGRQAPNKSDGFGDNPTIKDFTELTCI